MEQEQVFITDIEIKKVRHLENLHIHLSKTEPKHLILTGKNGSGKTSVLEEILKEIDSDKYFELKNIENIYDKIQLKGNKNLTISFFNDLKFNLSIDTFKYFSTDRKLEVDKHEGVNDEIKVKNARSVVKFLAKLRTQQAFSHFDNDKESKEVVKRISEWFDLYEKTLRFIFEDETIYLKPERKEDVLNFYLISEKKEKFDFNTLSSGYSSLLFILFDLMMVMQDGDKYLYDNQGIVLIDEIETHLHISLQKKILPFLTSFFPNIQFIVTTHSPFILNSIPNAIVYDLEHQEVIEDLSSYSSEAIVEAYFEQDKYSDKLKKELNEYESLLKKEKITDEEKIRIITLNNYFNELPKFKAEEITIKLDELKNLYNLKVSG